MLFWLSQMEGAETLRPSSYFCASWTEAEDEKKAPERQDSLTLCYKETVIALGNGETLQNKYTMFSVGMQEKTILVLTQ